MPTTAAQPTALSAAPAAAPAAARRGTLPADTRQQFESVGFVVLPGVFAGAELDELRRILDAEHAGTGAPSFAGWGYPIHPLLVKAPEMEPYYHHPLLVAAFEAILGGPVRLAHSGARMSSHESLPNIGWHQHYGWTDTAGIATRRQSERLLVNVYVDGSDRGVGPLIVLPRALNDPLVQPSADDRADWPGQRAVTLTPGSAVVFDTALWHTAKPGSVPGRRRLWGGHIMPLSDLRSHREDNGPLALQQRRLTAAPERMA